MAEWSAEIVTWWSSLAPEWKFLFALPILVAAVGLAAHADKPARKEALTRKRTSA